MRPLYQDVELRPRGRAIRRYRNRERDDEHAVVVTGGRAVILDRRRERNALGKLTVGDFLLRERSVPQPKRLGAATGDQQMPIFDSDSQAVGVGAGDFDYRDDTPVFIVNEDVCVGFEAAQPAAHDKIHL
jgi:hypothetical protein